MRVVGGKRLKRQAAGPVIRVVATETIFLEDSPVGFGTRRDWRRRRLPARKLPVDASKAQRPVASDTSSARHQPATGARAPISELDLAAAYAATKPTHPCFGNHDARGSFTTHLTRFLDGLFQRLNGGGKLVDGLLQRGGLDLETQWQYATGRQQLRLATEEDGPGDRPHHWAGWEPGGGWCRRCDR